MRSRLPPIFGIFLTVFLDMLSFGLVIPDLQLRGERLGASDFKIGLLLATYSVAQLITAPFLGRLSDRIGRRNILLLTILLSIGCFLFYAHATVLWIIFAARILAGISAANIGVAFAYVADITKPEDRARGIGIVGAAFGMGFVLGPPMGGFLVHIGNGSPATLGYTAAALCLINLLYVYLWLPEPETHSRYLNGESMGSSILRAFKNPQLGMMLLLYFAANFAFSNLESTFMRLQYKSFGLGELQSGLILGWVGINVAIVQGGLIRRLTGRFGEVRLLRAGFLVQIPALILLPFMHPWVPVLIISFMIAIGQGLTNPSINSLISRSAPAELQGSTFGISQSVGACARILGPLSGNMLFHYNMALPYLIAGLVMLFPLFLGRKIKIPKSETQEPVMALS